MIHYWFGYHETQVQRVLRRLVSPGDTAFDVGAYIGFYSLILGRLVGPGGRVFAFDPVAENCRRIESHAAMNIYTQGNLEPTFVKVDVEGAEAHVLRGAARLLRERRPTVICEIHNEATDKAVHGELTASGYRLHSLDLVPINVPPAIGHVVGLPRYPDRVLKVSGGASPEYFRTRFRPPSRLCVSDRLLARHTLIA